MSTHLSLPPEFIKLGILAAKKQVTMLAGIRRELDQRCGARPDGSPHSRPGKGKVFPRHIQTPSWNSKMSNVTGAETGAEGEGRKGKE